MGTIEIFFDCPGNVAERGWTIFTSILCSGSGSLSFFKIIVAVFFFVQFHLARDAISLVFVLPDKIQSLIAEMNRAFSDTISSHSIFLKSWRYTSYFQEYAPEIKLMTVLGHNKYHFF